MGEDFSRQTRRFSAAILTDCKGKATQVGGKKTAQTAFNGCEYRFLLMATVSAEQVSPLGGVVVAQPLGILPLEGDDVRPDVAGVLVQLMHNGIHVYVVLVTEETVGAGTFGHVLHVAGGKQFYTIAGADVLGVSTSPAAAAAFDVGTLDDQSCHGSSPSLSSP